MKYSEAKAIIKSLHEDGWYKIKGIDEYRKTWGKGKLRWGRFITFFELSHLNIPVKDLLDMFNEEAEIKLNEVKCELCEMNDATTKVEYREAIYNVCRQCKSLAENL